MDDISRELPPDDTGAAPVSERQKGPEELARFETLELLSLREASVSRRAVAALDKMPRLAEIRLDDRVIRRGRSS